MHKPDDNSKKTCIKLINAYHTNLIEPPINWSIVAIDKVNNIIDEHHAKDLRVKIYYTVQELANYVTELWFLHSLGDEILVESRRLLLTNCWLKPIFFR